MGLELHIWFEGEPQDNDFELLTEAAQKVKRIWPATDFEVVEVP
jgi:hypothetical protein